MNDVCVVSSIKAPDKCALYFGLRHSCDTRLSPFDTCNHMICTTGKQ